VNECKPLNVGMERDMESFREFFESPDFRTDGLKLYPTLVIRGTGLYELWRTGRYRNYAPDRLVDLVARALALVRPARPSIRNPSHFGQSDKIRSDIDMGDRYGRSDVNEISI
jgi:hypothetical protein